jgi:hypothetical protein
LLGQLKAFLHRPALAGDRRERGQAGVRRAEHPVIREIFGVVQNLPNLGYTNARKPPAYWGRILAAMASCSGGASLLGSSSLGLKRSQAEQDQPVRMALPGHQFPRAFASTLGTPATHEAPMVQEEL